MLAPLPAHTRSVQHTPSCRAWPAGCPSAASSGAARPQVAQHRLQGPAKGPHTGTGTVQAPIRQEAVQTVQCSHNLLLAGTDRGQQLLQGERILQPWQRGGAGCLWGERHAAHAGAGPLGVVQVHLQGQGGPPEVVRVMVKGDREQQGALGGRPWVPCRCSHGRQAA